MKATAIITDSLEPISSKAEKTFSRSPKMGHERSQPETSGNIISYRRDDSQPDGSIELCHDGDVNWAHAALHLGHQMTYSKNAAAVDLSIFSALFPFY